MGTISKRLTSFLEQKAVPYEVIHHRRRYTAQRTAEEVHVPGIEFAKTVLVWLDGVPSMVVLPAHHHVDLDQLRHLTGARDVDLATEDEMVGLFPDCEVGAEPPFGNLYDLPVYVAAELAADEQITFNAGSHEEVIRMRYEDFERLVDPLLLRLSEGETEH
jgi:Ala-tRNA(Pro) deacylase